MKTRKALEIKEKIFMTSGTEIFLNENKRSSRK